MNRILMILPLALLFACGSSDDDDKDGTDNTPPTTMSEAIITGTTQTPLCSSTTANAKGVGKSCTKGGGECAGTTPANQCSADAPGAAPPAPHFCTFICSKQSDCGADANCCLVNKGVGIATCVPKACGCPVPS